MIQYQYIILETINKMTTVSVFKLESLSKTELLDPQNNHQLPPLLVSLLKDLPIINII